MSRPTSPSCPPLTFVVEDSFLTPIGVLLLPSFELERFPIGADLNVSVVRASGEVQHARGRFQFEHLCTRDLRERYDGVVVLDASVGRVEPGTQVRCELA